jgi:hypothetical protein
MKQLITLIWLLPLVGFGQVSATLDSNSIRIGDQINLTLEGRIDNSTEWPVFTDSIGQMELISASPIDSIPTESGWMLKQVFLLTQWDSGFYKIPSIQIGQSSTEALIVTVNTIQLSEEDEAKDIKPPMAAPLTFKEALPYTTAVMIVIALLYLLFRYLKNRTEQVYEEEKAPIITVLPFQIALDKLESLKTQKKWQQGKTKEYYSDLSEIIRTYIEDGLDTAAMEMLTSDIIASLQRQQIESKELAVLLHTADMAKFAKAQPTEQENEKLLNTAFQFIHQTKPADNVE